MSHETERRAWSNAFDNWSTTATRARGPFSITGTFLVTDPAEK